MKPLFAALSLGTLLFVTTLFAQQPTTRPQYPRGQATAPQTSGMDPAKMMAEMQAADMRLQMLTDRMNSANGDAKVQAMGDVVNQLVTNELQMHQHFMKMMGGDTMPHGPNK